MKDFYRLLTNTLVASVTTSFLWFALTFWVYLETQNVMTTSILGGSFMLLMAATGMLFGTLVDRHQKKRVIEISSIITAISFVLAGTIFYFIPATSLTNIADPWFWVFTTLILIGCIVINVRNIALSTCVTIMVPEQNRANANGLVGMVSGIGFMITSIFSGLAIGFLGMGWTIAIAIFLTIVTLVDVLFVKIDEGHIVRDPNVNGLFDFRGAWQAIRAIPGLLALLLFATFNNLIGGVFMALLDPYGLTLVDVKIWGIIYALSSVGFIVGGSIVAKKGLGKLPLRAMLLANMLGGVIGIFMGIRESIWLLAGGMLVYMTLIPIVEAAEQTTLQKIVPVAKQGRVFGFGQSLEAAAAPITAYAIGPIAQLWVIPYMKTAEGQSTWGWLLGSGNARGMALIFMIAGIVIILTSLAALRSRSYKLLNKTYANTPAK